MFPKKENRHSSEIIPTVDRVRHIVALMTTGKWTFQTCYELAKVWGLDDSVVRRNASEASRFIAHNMGEPTEVRGKLLGMLEEAAAYARMAMETAPEKAGKLMVDIVRQHAALAGLNAPTKIAITDSSGQDIVPTTFSNAMSDPVGAELYLASGCTRIPSMQEITEEKARRGQEIKVKDA